MKLFDCFLFKDEYDMLELRLTELSEAVDRFVLVEAAQSFQHRPKPFHFMENRRRYDKWLHKITHVGFNGLIPDTRHLTGGAHYFAYESAQRNAIMRGLLDADDSDVATVCDVDEIPSRETMMKLREGITGKVRLHMQMHYYSLNHVFEWPWHLATASPVGMLRERGPQRVRQEVEPEETVWPDAGWHFSFFGSNDALRKKLADYADAATFNRTEFTSDENLDRVRREGGDFAHREKVSMNILAEPPSLPRTVAVSRERYEKLGWFYHAKS